MQKLIHNPLFRVVGILLILYYALFANKQHPDSLGNRFTAEKIKTDLHDVSSKKDVIIEGLNKAEEINKSAPKNEYYQQNSELKKMPEQQMQSNQETKGINEK